ncbi:MAG: hypothetical protein N2038_00275 [Geminicoccaceae bacterium]|nr:hypothetical protein [Geminicoccaceae bacterium]MCS7266750.1 hypothetical protein [Geminicoccaceae bacterium]MCX7628667.1 hypothetical protein [Geminicoccaceae bacterium]MDW8123772.1 hypothetical protein [Geminicoccaceae bacterium]MDW8341901.1 hypothetical protein [Geminicoccaceae bacterium]
MATTFCFSVHAHASPSALPRILDAVALCGLVPARCHAQLDPFEEDSLVVEFQLAGLSAREAAGLARRLGRIVGVESVLWSEKRAAA